MYLFICLRHRYSLVYTRLQTEGVETYHIFWLYRSIEIYRIRQTSVSALHLLWYSAKARCLFTQDIWYFTLFSFIHVVVCSYLVTLALKSFFISHTRHDSEPS